LVSKVILSEFENKTKGDDTTLLFQLFFLQDDYNQSVEVEETQNIDFKELIKRLNRGESVFIKQISSK
jgi:hypothetical protein